MSQYPIEHKIAHAVLAAGAQGANSALAPFVGWLATGIAAAFSLLLTNLDKVSSFVSQGHIRWAMLLLIAAMLVAVLAKLMAVALEASLAGLAMGTEMSRHIQESGRTIDVHAMVAELLKDQWPLQRRIMQPTFDKALAGERGFLERRAAKMAQAIGMMILSATFLIVSAAGILAAGVQT